MKESHPTKRLKVLYMITKGSWGGAQRYVYDLAVASQAAGYDVAVAYGTEGALGERLRAAGIRTHPIPALGRDIGIARDFASYRALGAVIRLEQPDVLHLNSSKAGGLGALRGQLAGVPKIIFMNHGWAFKEKRSLPARAAIWLASWITALLADIVISGSDFENELTKRMPFCRSKAIRIYNGIDLSMHFGSGDIIRNAFPAGLQIVGTVGELTKNKNQISLIERARKTPSIAVAIVGEGELRPLLEQKIFEYKLQDRVKLFGFLPAAEVLKGFDVFAFPSEKEALGYAVLEARAAGLPIEASRVGGVAEAIDRPLEEFSLPTMIQKTLALY